MSVGAYNFLWMLRWESVIRNEAMINLIFGNSNWATTENTSLFFSAQSDREVGLELKIDNINEFREIFIFFYSTNKNIMVKFRNVQDEISIYSISMFVHRNLTSLDVIFQRLSEWQSDSYHIINKTAAYNIWRKRVLNPNHRRQQIMLPRQTHGKIPPTFRYFLPICASSH